MNEEEIEKLAQMLKKQGLAISAVDARKLAKSITKVRKEEISTRKQETPKQETSEQQETKTIDTLEKVEEIEEVKEVPEPEKESIEEVKESVEEVKETRPDTTRFNKPDYDITQETRSLKELMSEDAEKIYKKEQEELKPEPSTESLIMEHEKEDTSLEEKNKEQAEEESEESSEEEKVFDDI